VNRLIALALPAVMHRSLRGGLVGVWGAGAPVPEGGAILIANHHSWWDGYLLWALARRAGRRLAMMIDAGTLERFPFFRRLGGFAPTELRPAARAARAGAFVVVFPEGALRHAGPPGSFSAGAQALSRWAGVPLLPVAVRVALRGRQRPEAYLLVGETLPSGAAVDVQHAALTALLARLDRDLAAAPSAEQPPAGYELWLAGHDDTHRRAERHRRWWSR
jgi:1-acyl-sn-glycerol-3-phosphate acyltransferase